MPGWMRIVSLLAFTLAPGTAQATQGHSGIEGVYVHQLAHVFFAFSLGTFIYWLRRRGLAKDAGWRLLQYAAFCFILWNADAFTVHFLEEQWRVMTVSRPDPSLIRVSLHTGFEWLGPVYYATKLDHLLCVPAMLFLYLGLRKLARGAAGQDNYRGDAP